MNKVVLLSVILSSSLAAELVEYKDTPKRNGGRYFKFVTSDGGFREESTDILRRGTTHQEIFVLGSYSFIDKDHKFKYTVKYTAGTEGFKPIIQVQRL